MEIFQRQAEKAVIIGLRRNCIRRYLIVNLLRYTVVAILLIIMAILGFHVNIDPGLTNSQDSLLVFIQICFLFFFLFMFCIFALGAWTLLQVMRRLLSQEPILEIREQGITVHELLLGTQFLAWADIAAISAGSHQSQSSSRSRNYLGIQLKNVDPYFLRFHPLVRMLLRRTMRVTGNPINVSEWCMSMPATEVVSEVQRVFRSTLYANHVHIPG